MTRTKFNEIATCSSRKIIPALLRVTRTLFDGSKCANIVPSHARASNRIYMADEIRSRNEWPAIYRVSHSRTLRLRMGDDRGAQPIGKPSHPRRSIASHVRCGVQSAILTWPAVDKRTKDILPYRIADSEAHLRFNERYGARYRRAAALKMPRHSAS